MVQQNCLSILSLSSPERKVSLRGRDVYCRKKQKGIEKQEKKRKNKKKKGEKKESLTASHPSMKDQTHQSIYAVPGVLDRRAQSESQETPVP